MSVERIVDRSLRKRVSSSIAQSDRLLDDLAIGDNVFWYEGSLSSVFRVQFIWTIRVL